MIQSFIMPIGLLEGKQKLTKYFSADPGNIDKSKTDQDDGQYLLDLINDAFKKHGLTCVLLFGTALGIYRDKKVIPYDDDVDVGVYDVDVPKLVNVVNELIKHNCCIERVYFNRIKMQYGNTKYHFDIWLMIPIRWSNIHYKVFGLKWFNSFTYYKKDYFNKEKLLEVKIKNTKYSLPNLIEDYLQTLYGTDWKTPIQGRECIERGIGSRVLLYFFVDHDVPSKFSGTGGLSTWKPWCSKFLLKYFPDKKFVKRFKHPDLTQKNKKIG